MEVVGEGVRRDGAHVDDESARVGGEVGGFETVVGHYRRGACCEADVCSEVLDDKVGHVMVERVGADVFARDARDLGEEGGEVGC